MGKSKRKALHTQKEEKQAKKVLVIIGVCALALVILMLVGYSVWGS
ncbi:MAG: hypothetical protein Q4D56_02170 [Bacteroides sp.]|nr:hypothetical protein [Bacteroides sp.]